MAWWSVRGVCVERADCVAAGGERRAAREEGKRVERIVVRLSVKGWAYKKRYSTAECKRSRWRLENGVVECAWRGRIVSRRAASVGPPGKSWSGEADRGVFTRPKGRAN